MAMEFARQRTAFGKKLHEHPLHQRTLARLDRELRAGFHFVMNVALLLGTRTSTVYRFRVASVAFTKRT